MLVILASCLLPLLVIAILASVQSAQQNRNKRQAEAEARLEVAAQRIDSALSRIGLTIGAATAAVEFSPPESKVCEATLRRLSGTQTAGRYALYGQNSEVRCATPGFVPPNIPQSLERSGAVTELLSTGEALRFTLFGAGGRVEGVGELPIAALRRLALPPDSPKDFTLDMVQGGRSISLTDGFRGGPLIETVSLSKPLTPDGLELRLVAGAVPISANEFVMILLPVLMWVGAAAIGWVIVSRLLLRPLVRMQKVVSAYQPGDRQFYLPLIRTPAQEIRDLGDAFEQLTRTVARHEADLEDAVERQRKLVREVHHRVKNNLQVVASLLNIHSRGSPDEGVAAAYASIQRRVDALAVVHRNHYAELEENRGVALKPLISELSSNLRGTAPSSAANMAIALNVAPVHVTQDVAVSVAFLITEIVEYGMFCGARSVMISLSNSGDGTALLSIMSDSLKPEAACADTLTERFERIITGLSRQLRSTMHKDVETGCYSLAITIV
ncbi:sensor histidine kinase [Allosphingosinicella flava]|uniref:histidine kinase n=2 Tax=Allosphingosinicella flava TaxID=2771430 RepID=A0A7T2LLH5_9SPHN|nr:sensor histidine kinase [Sphingosinicella flava]